MIVASRPLHPSPSATPSPTKGEGFGTRFGLATRPSAAAWMPRQEERKRVGHQDRRALPLSGEGLFARAARAGRDRGGRHYAVRPRLRDRERAERIRSGRAGLLPEGVFPDAHEERADGGVPDALRRLRPAFFGSRATARCRSRDRCAPPKARATIETWIAENFRARAARRAENPFGCRVSPFPTCRRRCCTS